MGSKVLIIFGYVDATEPTSKGRPKQIRGKGEAMICGTIINQDDLYVSIGLIADRFQAFIEIAFMILAWNDDTH